MPTPIDGINTLFKDLDAGDTPTLATLQKAKDEITQLLADLHEYDRMAHKPFAFQLHLFCLQHGISDLRMRCYEDTTIYLYYRISANEFQFFREGDMPRNFVIPAAGTL